MPRPARTLGIGARPLHCAPTRVRGCRSKPLLRAPRGMGRVVQLGALLFSALGLAPGCDASDSSKAAFGVGSAGHGGSADGSSVAGTLANGGSRVGAASSGNAGALSATGAAFNGAGASAGGSGGTMAGTGASGANGSGISKGGALAVSGGAAGRAGTTGRSGSGNGGNGAASGSVSRAGSSGAAGNFVNIGSAGSGGPSGTVTFSSDFNLTESPLSEGGIWKHAGLDWTRVNSANGNAFGTQLGGGAFDDSYAYLSGFPADQSVSAVIRKDPAFSTNSTREVELLLRWSDSAHDAHGYECNLASNGGYAEIVRWNGPIGSFTYVANQGSGGTQAGVHDGDVFSAEIRGNVIITRLNGVQLNTANVATIGGPVWTTGNPGMGFWKGGGSSFPGDYGFKSFSASSAP
jgi:hypothetical protein